MSKLKKLNYITIAFISLFSLNSGIVQAESIKVDTNSFDVYLGDLNNDGLDDFYFHELPLFVLIHGDISIPLTIKKYISFVIYSTSDGFEESELFSLTNEEIVSLVGANSLRPASLNSDVIAWQNPGKEEAYILLRGIDSTSPSAILINYAGFDLPTLSKVIDASNEANLSDKTLPVQIQDLNNDGFNDIRLNGFVYLSDFGGLPMDSPTLISAPGTFTETFIYDSLGRLEKVTASDGRTIEYGMDSEDNRTVTSKVKGISN